MILISVFENIKRKCFPSPRGWVIGHCSVGSAGRDRNCPEYRRSQSVRLKPAGLLQPLSIPERV
jgi:hypothetical protein